MARLRYWVGRLRAVLRPQRVHDEIAEEMALHIELQTEENIRRGMPPDQARREARQRFGHLTRIKEQGYELRGCGWVGTAFDDLSHGLRLLLRAPGFTVVAVVSLALGIGANTTIFSLVDVVLLKSLPVKNPEELAFIEPTWNPKLHSAGIALSRFFEKLRRQPFSSAGYSISGLNVSIAGQPELAKAELVSGNYFSLLGVNSILGRTLSEDDDGKRVVVLSYDYWQQRFGGDPSIAGKTLVLNGQSCTVVGIIARDFFGLNVGNATDLWAPAAMRPHVQPGHIPWTEKPNQLPPLLLGRFAPGMPQSQAARLVNELWQESLTESSELSQDQKQFFAQQGFELAPAKRGLSTLRDEFSRPLRVLMAVVAVVLLIACANVANLLLARSTARKKEVAIRLSLGIRRSRLVRQLLAESLLLALAAGVLSLVLAWCGSRLLLALVSSGHDPVSLKLAFDGRTLAFTAGISLLCAVCFGIAPALLGTRLELVSALNDSTGSLIAGPRPTLGRGLVMIQAALSVLLLIGAGLFTRTLEKLKAVDLGFDSRHVLVFSTDPRLVGYQEGQITSLYQRMLDRIGNIPGVLSVSLSRNGLLGGKATHSNVFILGPHLHADEDQRDDNQLTAQLFSDPNLSQVGPRFFETTGIALLRGRDIGSQDTETAPTVAVVNEAFANYYFGNADPIGRQFLGGVSGKPLEIVGLVWDEKYRDLRQVAPRTFYVPYLQERTSWRDTNFQVRTAGDPDAMVPAIRQAAAELDKNLPLYGIKTLETQVAETLVQERLTSSLSNFFALLSLLLAATGLYGTTAHAVHRRTQEIGARMALGAQAGDILKMMLKHGMAPVMAGIVLGLVLAFALTQVIASQLFGIGTADPLTFIAAPIVFILVALAACLGPSRRATRVDPVIALKN